MVDGYVIFDPYGNTRPVDAVQYDGTNFTQIEEWLTESTGYGWTHKSHLDFTHRRLIKKGQWIARESNRKVTVLDREPARAKVDALV